MQQEYFIQKQLQVPILGIKNTLALLAEGATVPFIARYRKERTGGLDEVEIAQIRDLAKKHDEILARHKSIIASIEEQNKLTEDLRQTIENCYDLNILEDLYLPYKLKKQTKADKAKKLGLEPLARMIMAQRGGNPNTMAEKFIKGEVIDENMALDGAKVIMAEWINENAALRNRLRTHFQRKSSITTKVVKGKDAEAAKYRDYFDFSQPLYKCAAHRILAILRAEREGFLSIKASPNQDESIEMIERFFVKGNDECSQIVAQACKDAYKRLLMPSLENEVLKEAKEKADIQSIKIFGTNLRQLLLAPPVGGKRTLAIDPGFRTGCKVVCLDQAGNLLGNATVFPHPPKSDRQAAQAKIAQLVQAYKIEVIAIGDGTAGRETEEFIKKTKFDRDLDVFIVNEDGASIYSASSLARKEFPDYDVTVRGAVSIGRRLMDPLAELVKIDPKSVGVGQYQHEVNQTLLKDALDDVVISCVNNVGVDLNTASVSLLQYVSGLGPTLAENIIAHRNEIGAFKTKNELKNVKRLGDKAFEQAAGFLRIRNGINPLDNSAIHPESYPLIDQLAKKKGVKTEELLGNKDLLKTISIEDFDKIDSFSFDDLMKELNKPGLDPRKKAAILEFDHRIKNIEDLQIGMQLAGIITNVTAFGAFVNIGIKENGLIHKSHMANTYVEDPSQLVKLHQHVHVQVLEVDVPRKRIGLKLLD